MLIDNIYNENLVQMCKEYLQDLKNWNIIVQKVSKT